MGTSGGAPTIAASAVAGVRHLLIEENTWADVRAELIRVHADAAAWIDSDLSVDPTKVSWVPITHHVQMMDALLAVVGPARTLELGRLRAQRTAQAGAFAPVVRSWTRSFGDDPSEFLKLTLHAWSSQTRNLGEFEVAESRAGHARYVLRNATPYFVQSRGWQQFLAGYGTGLLELAGRRGTCEIRVTPRDATPGAIVDIECVYDYQAARA